MGDSLTITQFWCVVLPVAVEAAWVFVLRSRLGDRVWGTPTTEREERREFLLIIAFIVYHWPLLPVALLVRGNRRVPDWALVALLVGTAVIYVGLLLWLESVV